MNFLKKIYYSFPFQLLLLHFQKHVWLLGLWVLLFAVIRGWLGSKLGLHYLFLDPEYLGKVNFLSFLILGLTFGAFLIIWNITTYLLNSERFPFLATLRRPFTKFSLNNFGLPMLFFVLYTWTIIQFQCFEKGQSWQEATLLLSGLYLGIIAIILSMYTYFSHTNRDIFGILHLRGLDKEEISRKLKKHPTKEETEEVELRWRQRWRVDHYLAHPFRLRIVRSIEHYDNDLLRAVFQQNHTNVLIVECIAIVLLLGLGGLVQYEIFRIPAAASMCLLFLVVAMLIGAVRFWLGGWETVFIIIGIGVGNFLLHQEVIDNPSRAYGLDYQQPPAAYSYDSLRQATTYSQRQSDKQAMRGILRHWKQKIAKKNSNKPKMVFLNVSGGGLRSAVWTLNCLQTVEQQLNGELLNHTFLITGASGGMIGAAYFRELLLRQKQGENIQLYNDRHLERISSDLLNAVSFTIATNDVFFPLYSFEYDGTRYKIDRGYAFERQLNENTNFILDKPLGAYRQPEQQMTIPLMILSPTIITDARSLYISPQPLSFLTRHQLSYHQEVGGMLYNPVIDGVEFSHLFRHHEASNLRFTTALRMSSTFPYVSPAITLPTEPEIRVMDAGMRDNFGTETTVQFIHSMREWLQKNTSGIIILRIQDVPNVYTELKPEKQGILERLVNPVGNFYLNWQDYQQFYHQHLLEHLKHCYPGSVETLSLQYLVSAPEKRAALSWHLTSKEKANILEALNHDVNQVTLERLEQLLGDD